MNTKSTIAVLGGNGRTGSFLVKALLNHGYSVKLLIRPGRKIPFQHDGITIVEGDALDFNAVTSLLKGCQAVMSTIGQRKDEPLVAAQATKHILDAMETEHIHRFILLAGLNIDAPHDNKGQQTLWATKWMKDNFPTIDEDRQRSYELLEQHTLIGWTVARVPYIEFLEATGRISVNVEDCPGSKINAGDIAEFMVSQLMDGRFIHRAPFIANL